MYNGSAYDVLLNKIDAYAKGILSSQSNKWITDEV